MSAFSTSSFDAARYAASRPTYPPVLLNMVLHYHLRGKSDGEGKNKALDQILAAELVSTILFRSKERDRGSG